MNWRPYPDKNRWLRKKSSISNCAKAEYRLQVTLRGVRMYEFVDKLFNVHFREYALQRD